MSDQTVPVPPQLEDHAKPRTEDLREPAFAGVLLTAFGLITAGCWTVSQALGLIVAGALLAVWGWLVLGEVNA